LEDEPWTPEKIDEAIKQREDEEEFWGKRKKIHFSEKSE
jgi:hypothetical protein